MSPCSSCPPAVFDRDKFCRIKYIGRFTISVSVSARFLRFVNQGFEVIGLAAELGTAGTDPEKVANFINEMGVQYPILFGEMEAVIEISKRYGNRIGGLPYSEFIDRNGVVLHVKFGELSLDEAEEMLGDIL